MLSFLLGLAVISLSGVMLSGPMFAVTIDKSNKSPFAGAQIAAGHAIVEVPLAIFIYFGFARFLQEELTQVILNLAGAGMLFWLGMQLFKTNQYGR